MSSEGSTIVSFAAGRRPPSNGSLSSPCGDETNREVDQWAAVWGSLTLVIQFASRAVSCFGRFMDLTMFLLENLHRTERYAKLFHNDQNMKEALKLLYCDFIDYCVLSMSFFQRKGISLWWRVLWPTFERKLTNIDARMRSHQTLVDLEASAATMLSTATAEADAQEFRTVWRYRDIILWLQPTDVQADYERFKAQRLGNLGDWLLDEDYVKQWQKGDFDVLCVNGIPGCGKTMLMTAVLDRLLAPGSTSPSEDCTIFFFCDAASVETKGSSIALLRSLIAQLLAHDPQLANVVYQMGIKSGQPRATSLINLTLMLQSLLDAQSTFATVTVLIDALEECLDMEESRILDVLLGLVGKSRLKVRILVSSRAEPGLHQALKKYRALPVTSDKTYADIETYIRVTLQQTKLATLQEGRLLSHITNKLMTKSNSQFLWVRLILHELRKATFVSEINTILDDLPTGLQQAYLRVFQRLATEPRRRQEAARSLFGWLACTERPLSMAELECALALREGDQKSMAGAQLIHLPTLLEEVCGSLVEIAESNTPVVRFVHITIKEFLVAAPGTWKTENQTVLQFQLHPTTSHSEIASTCLTQLLFPGIERIAIHEERKRLKKEYHLLGYASMFWATHLAKSGHPETELLRRVLPFLDSKQMEAYLEWYSEEKTTSQSIILLQAHLTTWISRLNAGDPRMGVVMNRFRGHFERTVQRRAQIFGLNSPEHLESIQQLAKLLHASGSWEEAERLACQSAGGREKLFGFNDPLTLSSNFQLGSLLRRLGNVSEAKALHTMVLDGRRTVLGMYHTDTLETEDELATTTNAAKTLQQTCAAETMSRATLRRKIQHYGKDHERTAATENILASILKDKALMLRDLGQDLPAMESLGECEDLCLSCLKVRRAVCGDDHPEVSTTWNMLGIVTQLLGRLEESEEWHQKAFIARQKVFGTDNPHTQRSMRNLVNTYTKQYEMEKADRMRRRLNDSLRNNSVLLDRKSWLGYNVSS